MPDNIDKAKQKATDVITSNVDEMGQAAYYIMLSALEKHFDFKGGKIVADKNFVKQLNKLTVEVLDLLQADPKFTGPVSQFIKRLTPISDVITDFQKSENGITVPSFAVAKNIVIDEIINQMLENGLNENFVQPLRDLIYQNVTSGLSLKDAKENIKEYIKGGKDQSGKLGQYLEQTAQQGVDSYSGMISTKLLEQFDYDGLLMTGSLIETSSPQCRFVREELDGKITRENWPQVKKIAEKHGLMPDTTFDNLPLHLLHWSCRHSFFPIRINKTA
jgi:hypothetical protein